MKVVTPEEIILWRWEYFPQEQLEETFFLLPHYCPQPTEYPYDKGLLLNDSLAGLEMI